MTSPTTRLRTDRFGDMWTVHTGPAARRLRREIEREFDAALGRYDAEPTPANLAECVRLHDTQAEIGRRLARRAA